MKKKLVLAFLSILLIHVGARARDVLVEIKGSGFFPTSHLFKKIYHSTGVVGGEVTVNLCDCFYGFFSVDYLRKNGLSLIGQSKTKVNFLPLGFGLKYLYPFCYGDWYIGLGALAARIHTHDFSPYVAPYYTKWGWGGIVKFGALFDVSCSLFIDVFINYSFVRAGSHNTNGGTVFPHAVKVNGAIIGLGLGYRF